MADKPIPKKKRTSAANRQDGDYAPPVLAEPKGGPIPGRKAEVKVPPEGGLTSVGDYDQLLRLRAERAAAHDDQKLHHYWTQGKGKAKWVGSPKPWTTLVAHLTKHVGLAKAKVYASRWFFEIFGFYAGSDKNRVTHGKPPRGKVVGPG